MQAPALELDDARRDGVEEVPVVRDEHERAGEVVGEEVLEPLGRVRVEVVGRLVEDGDVRAGHEELRQRDAPPLAAAALAARAIDVAHPELVEEAERLVPALPAAEPHDGVVELGLLVDQSVVRAVRPASSAVTAA